MGVHRAQNFWNCLGCPDALINGWVGAAAGIVTGYTNVTVVAVRACLSSHLLPFACH